MAIVTEKQALINCLKKYRELPALWDHSHEYYSNKTVRREGMHTLLEIYRVGDPDMSFYDFKKKLENMRTTYRRERVKVIKSIMNGGKEYVPTLWYYKYYTFLDDVVSPGSEHKLSPSDQNTEMVEIQDIERVEVEDGDIFEAESHCNSPPPKKKKKKQNIIYLHEDVDDRDIKDQVEALNSTADYNTSQDLSLSSTELFAKATGLQLSELKPMQRFIAEKLISEVIFYGRLDKLQQNTSLTNIDN